MPEYGDVVEGRNGSWEPWSGRRAKEIGAHWGTHKKNVFPKSLAWKIRETEIHEFLQPAGLKALSLKGQQAWLKWSQEGTELLLERSHMKYPGADSTETRI